MRDIHWDKQDTGEGGNVCVYQKWHGFWKVCLEGFQKKSQMGNISMKTHLLRLLRHWRPLRTLTVLGPAPCPCLPLRTPLPGLKGNSREVTRKPAREMDKHTYARSAHGKTEEIMDEPDSPSQSHQESTPHTHKILNESQVTLWGANKANDYIIRLFNFLLKYTVNSTFTVNFKIKLYQNASSFQRFLFSKTWSFEFEEDEICQLKDRLFYI